MSYAIFIYAAAALIALAALADLALGHPIYRAYIGLKHRSGDTESSRGFDGGV